MESASVFGSQESLELRTAVNSSSLYLRDGAISSPHPESEHYVTAPVELSSEQSQGHALRGAVPLILCFEDADEELTVPDPDELPRDLGLSPSHKYLLRFVRENMECSGAPNDADVSAIEHTGLNRMQMDSEHGDAPEFGLNQERLNSSHAQRMNNSGAGLSMTTPQQQTIYQLPSEFSPNGVKSLLRKVSRAVEIGPITNKRRYQFHSRIAKPQKSPPMKRKLRLQRALRGENPFLGWRTQLHCCDRYRCFASLCPNYLYDEYKRVNSMNKVQSKRYLISLFNVNDKLWYLRDRKVCSRFLQKAFGFSTDLQCQVKCTPRARAAPTAQRLPREVTRKTKRWYISQFLLKLAQRFAEAMPHKEEFALPVFTKTMLWKEFEKHWNTSLQTSRDTLPSKCYFFRVWKMYATMVKVQKMHGFTVCTRCEMLRKEMADHLQDEETLNVLLQQYAKHLRFVEGERDAYEVRQSLAEENPGKYCSIILDGADQKNYGLPHFPNHTKSDVGHKLKVKVVGCLEHVLRGGEQLSLYAMTEEYETGANHVIEVAHRVLQRKKEMFGKLPPNLFVQVDNCIRENKNRFFFGYFQSLVHLGVFKTVQVSFLPIGHTHADIDQSFSSIGAHLSINEAFTFEDMLCELSKCYAGRAKAFDLDRIVNYSGLCVASGCLANVADFTEYRFFRFVCKEAGDNRGLLSSTCDVKVQEKEDWKPFPSSRAEGFLKFVPNFRDAPQNKTKELTNFVEVSKSLDSAEERVKDEAKMAALRSLRDKVFDVRQEDFHWKVENVFEMKGDYLTEVEHPVHLPSFHVEEQMRSNSGYDPDDLIAVETKEDDNTKFWIARVKSVSMCDEHGRARELNIRWYVPRGSDPWNAKYVPAWKGSHEDRSVYEDTVDVSCIILRFSSFTTAGKLRVSHRKAIKQMLDAN